MERQIYPRNVSNEERDCVERHHLVFCVIERCQAGSAYSLHKTRHGLNLWVFHYFEQPLHVRTSIIEVHEEANHALLILGVPRVNKSTLLLDLALQTETDEAPPVSILRPHIFLATMRLSLLDWLGKQLMQVYDIPTQLGNSLDVGCKRDRCWSSSHISALLEQLMGKICVSIALFYPGSWRAL